MPRNAPSRGAAAFDKGTADFWRAVKGGDFLSLGDAEAFSARLAAGTISAQDYLVGDIRDFELVGKEGGRAARGAASARDGRSPRAAAATRESYRFIELTKEGSGPLYLALVAGPGRFELRLYFIPSGLESGTRDELLDRGETWLFLPPADPEDFDASELEYAPYPDVPEIEDAGVSRKLVFARVGPGCLYGESLDTRVPVIIAEYAAESSEGTPGGSSANDLLLVLEEGWLQADGAQPAEGGYVTVMLGQAIRPGDIEHYPS